MTVHPLDALKAEPKRDRFGRYLLKMPDGSYQPHTRATTVAETIDDRHNLENWMQRMVALGIGARRDLYAQACALTVDDKKSLNELCDQAREAAAAKAGANLGTALHRFTERVDAGEVVDVPPPWDADVVAYQQALTEAGIEIDPTLIELCVVHNGFLVSGTFDRLVRWGRTGELHIADLKTGADLSYSWGAIAQQLALYANADERYDHRTEQRQPLPPINREVGLVVHLPAGQATCTVHEVDLVAGWEAFQQSMWVREYRRRAKKSLARPLVQAAIEVPTFDLEAMADWLRSRIRVMVESYPAAADELAATWPADLPTLRQGGHTAAQLELIARALDAVESKHQLPFVTGDPRVAKPEPEPPAVVEPAPVPEPAGPPASPAVIASTIERLQALPPDILAAVGGKAAIAGVPNLRSGLATVEDLDKVEAWLAEAELAWTERMRSSVPMFHGLLVDDDKRDPKGLAGEISLGITDDVDRFTAADVERLVALDRCVADGLVRWTTGNDINAPRLIADAALEAAIVGSHGGARKALAAVKDHLAATADAYPAPRSMAALLTSPVLGAVAARGSASLTETTGTVPAA